MHRTKTLLGAVKFKKATGAPLSNGACFGAMDPEGLRPSFPELKKSQEEMKKKTVFLYTNGGAQDAITFPLLKQADIPFTHFNANKDTPRVEYNGIHYVGIDEIKCFIEIWRKEDK